MLIGGLLAFAERTEDVKHSLGDHVDCPDDEAGEYRALRVGGVVVCVDRIDFGPA